MNGIGAIRGALEGTRFVTNMYLSDFSDADMQVRPVPGANHAAWQMGHVIVGDVVLIREQLPDAVYPELPPGFIERHGTAGAAQEGPEGFLGKDEYVALFDRVRSATIAALEGLSEADLDRPTTGQLSQFAPTLGQLFLLVSNHTLLHSGQFTVIRRKLGKPVLF
jgi:hypothetical protein